MNNTPATLSAYQALNALDDAACIFEQLPLRPDGLRDYRYHFVNNAFRKLFDTGDLAGLSVRDNFPHEPESWYDDYDEVLSTGIPKRLVREALSQQMLLEMYVTMLEDGSGKYLMNTIRDITVERSREEALRESETNIRNLIMQAPVAMALLTGPELVVELINDTFIGLWGKDASVRGKPILEALPEMRGQAYPDILRNVYASGETYYGNEAPVLLYRRGQMEHCYFNFVNEPYRDASGRTTGIIVVAAEVTAQVVANRNMYQMLEKIRLAKEAAGLGMFDYDLVSGTLEWDTRCRELFGVSHTGPVNYEQDFLGGLHPGDRERLEAIVKDCFNKSKTDGVYDAEYRTIGRDDGRERWVRARGQVYFDQDNNPLRFIGSVLDITDSKHFEQEQQRVIDQLMISQANLRESNDSITRLNTRLAESETDFKRLVEKAPVAMLVFRGPDMVIDLVNEAMLSILGKGRSIIGRPLLEGLPEIKGAPAVEQLFQVYRTGKPSDGNEAAVPIFRDGEVRTCYFNFSYRPLLEQGKVVGVMDVAVEVTEQVIARKRLEGIVAEKTALEQDLRSNQRHLQGVLDTMAEGVIIVDDRAKVTYANAMAQRIIGRDENDLKERTYNDERWQNLKEDGTELPLEEHPIFVVLRTGKPVYDREIGIVRPGQDKLYISINAAPLVDEQQKITGGIVTFTDVTARRKILQQKDDFISVASHELKTPVTSLKASLQLLYRKKNDMPPEMLDRLLNQANKSLDKLSVLVDSLLNVNRISQGRFPVRATTFPAARLIEDCAQHIRNAGSHEIIVEGDLDAEITADEQLVDQVLINLLNNAAKYAPRSPRILVRVEKIPGEVKISVSDSGPGIPPDKVGQLFERYYQAGQDGSHLSGLGLGLYISSEIISKHGGRIGVDSEPGRGSTFWFTLPETFLR